MQAPAVIQKPLRAPAGPPLADPTGERLREAEERYRRLVEKLPAITYIAEPGAEGGWLFVSPQIEDMLGYSAEEWQADPNLWASRLHPADRERVIAEEGNLAAPGEPAAVEYRMLARDGRVLWVRDEAVLGRQRYHGREVVVFEGLLTEVTERKELEARLRYNADHDALTGLLNRRRFEEELRRRVEGAARNGERGAVLIFDIDHFKLVNDSFGHAMGDDVLRAAARCLREELRETDVPARLGGDEFAAIICDVDGAHALSTVRDVLDRVRSSAGDAPVTASGGVVPFDGSCGLSADDVLVRADLALYEAKESGRDQVSLFDGRKHGSLAWLDRLRRAIAEDRLVLHSQPVVELSTGSVVQEELLVRMVDEEGEVVPPAAFLHVAERFGLVREIDRWVVREAVRLAASGRRVAVNVSAQSICGQELTGQLERDLRSTGADPASIVVEITETSAVANLADARRFVERVARIGAGVALDDFGTGFSSFAYLKHLPVQWLKIDMEFIRELARSRADQRIVKAIATIAEGFEMRTVAEGVEDADTLRLLRGYGIDCAQGFHLARPGPAGGAGRRSG